MNQRDAGRPKGAPVKHAHAKEHGKISDDYDDAVLYLKQVFQNHDPIQFRDLRAGTDGDVRVCIVYCDGMVDSKRIDDHMIRPLMEVDLEKLPCIHEEMLLSKVFQLHSAKSVSTFDEVIDAITSGETAVFVRGLEQALIFDTKGFDKRSIAEPEGEKILSGPREGFTESLLQNTAMVQRKVKTEHLKMTFRTVGTQTKTKLCVAYIQDIANAQVVEEMYSRLDGIDIDGILDSNYINELIRDNPRSPFRSMGYTERPDVIAAKLLEGRVALFVDGTPVVLTAPYLFVENFQSNEDYYLNFYFTSFTRMLRIVGFLLTTMLPSLYIATVAFHHEMLPSPLFISITMERSNVPLPAALEAVIMLLVFEILRETAVRMQANVGQALSIVGALVVGQAAVEAKLVAAPMLIVIAMSGITSLLIPKMIAPILLVRFGMLILASCYGYLGVTIGFAFLLTHILDLHSFGVWQLSSDRKLQYQGIKDTFFRAPIYLMLTRPFALSRNTQRQRRKPEDQA